MDIFKGQILPGWERQRLPWRQIYILSGVLTQKKGKGRMNKTSLELMMWESRMFISTCVDFVAAQKSH